MSTMPIPPAASPRGPATPAPVAAPSPVAIAPSRAAAAPLGFASLASALVGLGFLCFGDPYWLSLPTSLLAVALGQIVLRKIDVNHAAANIGNSLGQCVFFLWVAVDVVLGLIAGVDFTLIDLAGK